MNTLPRSCLLMLTAWVGGILTCIALETNVTYSVMEGPTVSTVTCEEVSGLTDTLYRDPVPLADGEVRYYRIRANKTIKSKKNFYGPLETEVSLSMPAIVCRGESSELYVTASIKNMAEHSRFGNISIRLIENDFAPWFPGNIKFEEPQGDGQIELGPGVDGITNIPPTWQTAKPYRVWVDSWEPAPDNVAEVRAECLFADNIPGQGSIYYSTDVLNIPIVDTLPPASAPGIRRRPDGWVEIYWDAANTRNDWSAPVSTASFVTVATTVSPTGGGTTEGQGSYGPGSKVTLTASPSPGYRFDRWEGYALTKANPLVLWPDHDVGFSAVFVQTAVITLLSDPPQAGELTGGGVKDLNTLVSIAATDKPGYKFLRWERQGVAEPLSISHSTNVLLDQSMTLTAVFEEPFWLNVSAGPGGAAGGSGQYVRNFSVPISARPQDGFFFIRWLGDGIADPQAAETTVLLDGAKEVRAIFGGDGGGNIEYYVDVDPGVGHGILVDAPDGAAVFTVDTLGLEPGVHRLVIRTRGTDGEWVSGAGHSFVVADPSLAQTVLEYAIDAEPGNVASPQVPFVNGQAVLNIPAAPLTEGVHSVQVRQKRQDNAVLTGLSHQFLVMPSLAEARIDRVEYLTIADDPQPGWGRVEPVNPGSFVECVFHVPSWRVVTGINSVLVRACTTAGTWGNAIQHQFLAEPSAWERQIGGVEWFLTRNGQTVTGSWGSKPLVGGAFASTSFNICTPSTEPGAQYQVNVQPVSATGIPGTPATLDFAVILNPGALYQKWVNESGYFPGADATDKAISGFLADPDGDGSPNGCEYAFGTNPRDSSALFQSTAETQNDHLVIRYRQKKGGEGTVGTFYTAGGVRYTVQYGESLEQTTWRSGGDVVEAVGTPVDNGDGTETVTVRAKAPISAAPTGFLRVYLELL